MFSAWVYGSLFFKLFNATISLQRQALHFGYATGRKIFCLIFSSDHTKQMVSG
jgi:hypothetical protein